MAEAVKELNDSFNELWGLITDELERAAKKMNDIWEGRKPMTTSERLAEITRELQAMAELPESGQDVEASHVAADKLLIEALRLTWNQDVFATHQVEDIIEAWNGVPKWYA
jgi:hypothetical protein